MSLDTAKATNLFSMDMRIFPFQRTCLKNKHINTFQVCAVFSINLNFSLFCGNLE